MVSSIWNAASEGNIDLVKEILKDTSNIDVEIKDDTGATPLIQAVRNGHVDVVKELLYSGGVNPFTSTAQGGPETYTTDEAILNLLTDARNAYASAHPDQVNLAPQESFDPQQGYQDQQYDPSQAYYRPMVPPAPDQAYAGYYIPEGGYYLPPPPSMAEYRHPGSFSGQNMPPPEISKSIPCRYFPACRYGASCAFAHPQPTYYAGPPPPPHYPPYDPNAPVPYPPPYYQGPPNYPPAHVLPSPSANHQDGNSLQAPSPETNGTFSPPPSGYIMSPVTPAFVPAGAAPNGPPAQPYPVPYQNTPGAYPQVPYPPVSPTHHRHESIATYPYPPYPPQPTSPTVVETDFRKHPREHDVNGHHSREPSFSSRRGGRRPSLSSNGIRKTPLLCMFFPSGKCRNGDECRFLHVLPEDGQLPYVRGGYPFAPRAYRSRALASDDKKGDFEVKYPHHGASHPDKATIAQQLASLPSNMRSLNLSNGHRNAEKASRNGNSTPKQRVPNADDFPSLNGSTRAPSTAGSVHSVSNGKTAAQILKSSPPVAKFRPKEAKPDDTSAAAEKGTTDSESVVSSSNAPVSKEGSRSRTPEPAVSVAEKISTSAIEVPPVVA